MRKIFAERKKLLNFLDVILKLYDEFMTLQLLLKCWKNGRYKRLSEYILIMLDFERP